MSLASPIDTWSVSLIFLYSVKLEDMLDWISYACSYFPRTKYYTPVVINTLLVDWHKKSVSTIYN